MMPHPKVYKPQSIAGFDERQGREIVRAANGTVRALKELVKGEVVEGSALIGSSSGWRHAKKIHREASERVLDGIVEDFRWSGSLVTGATDSSAAADEADFRLLTSKGAKGYEHGAKDTGLRREQLPRGTMVDGPPEDLGLPPEGCQQINVMEISQEISSVYQEFRTAMLKRPEDVPWSKMDAIKPFWSPTYKEKTARLALALRLFLCGMLSFTSVCIHTVAMFTVVKKHEKQSDGRWRTWLRPVWDERAGNMMWRDPPWVSLGSPNSFCNIDLSQLPSGIGLGSVCGDIPNYFYMLRNPSWLWPFFCLPDITAQEFQAYARRCGVEVVLPEGAIFCAVTCVLMGWSWAPYVAQTALSALFDRLFNPMTDACRLINRVVVPRIGTRSQCQEEKGCALPPREDTEGDEVGWMMDVIYLCDKMVELLSYIFIDDYGLLQLIPLDTTTGMDALRSLAEKARGHVEAAGLGPVHKEQMGEGLESGLGMTITGRPYVVRVARNKMLQVRGATRHLLRMKAPSPAAVEALMGNWSWIFQAARCAYAIPNAVFAYIHKHRGDGPTPLWPVIRAEVWTMLMVSPLVKTGLCVKWLMKVFAGDSSGGGFGIVETPVTQEELRREAKWTTAGSWPVASVEKEYRLSEEVSWGPADDRIWHLDDLAAEQEVAMNTKVATRPETEFVIIGGTGEPELRRFRRDTILGLFEDGIEVAASTVKGVLMTGVHGARLRKDVEEVCQSGRVGILACWPGRLTWSEPQKGVASGRTVKRPWGLATARGREGREIRSSNEALRAFLSTSTKVTASGGVAMLVQQPKECPGGWMWSVQEVEQWLNGGGVQQGPMTMVNDDGVEQKFWVAVKGLEAGQVSRMTEGKGWTALLVKALSGRRSAAEPRIAEEEGEPEDPRTVELGARIEALPKVRGRRLGVKRPRMMKRPPPSVHECFDDVGRWRLTWKGRWRQREHINVLELRTITKLARRLSLQRGCWGRKIVFLTDSMAAMGAATKGRSSAFPLLRQCRVLAALSLGLEIHMKLRWIESERNISDGPSRGLGIGAAEETVLVHALRAQLRKARALV